MKLIVKTVSAKEPGIEESSLQESALKKIQVYTQEKRPQAKETSTADLQNNWPAAESEHMSSVSPCQQQQQNIKAVGTVTALDQPGDELLTVKQEPDETIELGEEIFFDENGTEEKTVFTPVQSFQNSFNKGKMILYWNTSR